MTTKKVSYECRQKKKILYCKLRFAVKIMPNIPDSKALIFRVLVLKNEFCSHQINERDNFSS